MLKASGIVLALRVNPGEAPMHEVFLPIMIMIFTLLVMFGLVVIFRGWLIERDRLVAEGDRSPGAAPVTGRG
jgi:hypothetical protein